MEQMRPTQFRYHQLLHDDRRRTLRGCDDRTYATLAQSPRPPRRRRGLLHRLAGLVRIPRRGGPEPVPDTPPPAADDVLVLPADEPVVCIDLGNPLAATAKPATRRGRPPGGQI